MREMSVAEQRYKAVMAVISEGRTITQLARDWGVSRQTMHAWLARYEADGLDGLANLSHRLSHCPHQMAGPPQSQTYALSTATRYGVPRSLAWRLRPSTQPQRGSSWSLPMSGCRCPCSLR